MNIIEIIQQLASTASTNDKLKILETHKDNELFTRLLKLTYCKVTYTYGVSLASVPKQTSTGTINLAHALDRLQLMFASRKVTGNAAIELLKETINRMSESDALIISRVIDRDLKIGVGRTQINKVHKNLIVKPVYMRCSILTEKTKPNVEYPVIVDLKADGTYREITVLNGHVLYNSRQGNIYDYPTLTETFKHYPDGKYIGELTVVLDQELLDKVCIKLAKNDKKNGSSLVENITKKFNEGDKLLPRSIGNGLLKSHDVPHNNIKCDLWDYVSIEEYNNATNRVKNTTPYSTRKLALTAIIGDGTEQVQIIESYVVDSLEEAMAHTARWMRAGLEGSILKNMNAVFRDGTSTEQWKVKLKMEIDVRVTGFIEGKIGTKRVKTFGSMMFETDDRMVRGSTSGFSDKLLEYYNNHREETTGIIITVECNDIIQASGNDYYALSHPRFTEERSKNETDDLARVLEIRENALMGKLL